MAVYVDNYSASYRGMSMSHMVADTLTELHQMAEQLGLKRSWFQDKGRSPHYDVCKTKRDRAIGLGAKLVSSRDLVLVLRRGRERGFW